MGIDHLDNDQTQWSLNGNGLQGTFNGELTTSAKLFDGKRAGRFKLAERCNVRTLCTTKVRTYLNDDDGANDDDDSDEDGDGKGDDGVDGGDDGGNDDDAG
jgi:hypothetical protein